MKKDNITTIALASIIILLITFSTSAKGGASNGLNLCESIIIPSLLPILIITSMITKSNCSLVIDRLFGLITQQIFKLPRCATGAIIFGLIGGYPTGTILTYQLYENGLISDSDAKRIMSFNMCGGVAFIITAVGTISLKSTRLGVMLYLSNIAASLFIALLSAIKKPTPTTNTTNDARLPLADAMIESVDDSARAIINMSTYIILFSAIASIIPLPSALHPIIEITNGIIGRANPIPLPYISFFLCFGGLCIHFQLINLIRKMNIGYLYFLTTRLIASLLSLGITKIYLMIFPQADEVFSNIAQKTAHLTQVNTGLSFVMILGCVIIIFDVENKKYKLI